MADQLPFDFDRPLRPLRATARHSDPDTSHEAAEAWTEDRLTEVQAAVLAFFRRVLRATDEQLQDALRERYSADSTLRKRRTDLYQRGYLRDSGEREWNRNGRKMIVWELVA